MKHNQTHMKIQEKQLYNITECILVSRNGFRILHCCIQCNPAFPAQFMAIFYNFCCFRTWPGHRIAVQLPSQESATSWTSGFYVPYCRICYKLSFPAQFMTAFYKFCCSQTGPRQRLAVKMPPMAYHSKEVPLFEHPDSMSHIVVYIVLPHFRLKSWPVSIIFIVPGPGPNTGWQSNANHGMPPQGSAAFWTSGFYVPYCRIHCTSSFPAQIMAIFYNFCCSRTGPGHRLAVQLPSMVCHPTKEPPFEHPGSMSHIAAYIIILHFRLNSWPFFIIFAVPEPGSDTGWQSNCQQWHATPRKCCFLNIRILCYLFGRPSGTLQCSLPMCTYSVLSG